jgi:hypothetical protein
VTFGLLFILLHDAYDFLLDIGESIVTNVRNLVLDAVFFETKALSCEEDISLTSGRKIRNSIANEDDEWDLAFFGSFLCFCAGFLYGKSLVVAELGIVAPYWLPL